METITKSELLSKFENNEFIQINFPKMDDDEIIHLRSDVQKIDHFNTVYRDGKKLYLERTFDAIERLAKRCKVDPLSNYENLEFCLYMGEYDFKQAKDKFYEYYY